MPQISHIQKVSAALIGHWPELFAWLAAKEPAFDALAEADTESTNPTFCPIHGGESGEAFHTYPDFPDTGGCVCNSCGSFGSGMAFLAHLATARHVSRNRLATLVDGFLRENGIAEPALQEVCALSGWAGSHDAIAAVTYLTHRGIPNLTEDTLPPAIRGAVRDDNEVHPLPQMRVLMSFNGTPLTAQRILLSPDCTVKNPDVEQAKLLYPVSRRGLTRGAVFDLSARNAAGDTLYMGEGVETLMAVRGFVPEAVLQESRFFALGGAAGRFSRVTVPEGVREIHLCADADHTLPEAQASAARLARDGYRVVLHVPQDGAGKDWLEVLNHRGLEAARTDFAAAASLWAAGPVTLDGAGDILDEDGASERPSHNLDTPDALLFQLLETQFARFCRSAWFLQLTLPETTPVKISGVTLEPLTSDDLTAAIAEHIDFYNLSRDGMRFTAAPRARIATWFTSALARGFFDTHLRPLKSLLLRPSLVRYRDTSPEQPEGVIRLRFLRKPGYDEKSQHYLLLSPADGVALAQATSLFEYFLEKPADVGETPRLPLSGDLSRHPESFQIPTQPLLPDALSGHFRQAFLRGLPDILRDFQFATPSDYVNALLMFVTPLFSPSCQNLPLFLIQAPARGAGKTTLAHAFSALWGSTLQIAAPDDDTEMEKRMATAFTTGKTILLLDNLNRLDAPSLTNMLTSGGTYEVRKLGSNSSIPMPAGFMIVGTGNNPVVQHELARRIVFIDLDPPKDIVTEDVRFSRPDLPGWVGTPRNQLATLRVLYTCLLYWESLGFPMLGTGQLPDEGFHPKLESFNEFAALTTSFLALFMPGKMWPLAFENQRRYLDVDSESDEITQFVAGWKDKQAALPRCEGNPDWYPVASLLALAERLQVPSSILEYRRTGAGQTQRMGIWLSRLANRRFALEGRHYRILRNTGMLTYKDADGQVQRTRAYKLEAL